MELKHTPNMASLIQRFNISAVEAMDPKVRRLLEFKLSLDTEIYTLLHAGAREARIKRMIKLIGLDDPGPRVIAIIDGILNARDCLGGLRPKKPKETPAHVTEQPTKEKTA